MPQDNIKIIERKSPNINFIEISTTNMPNQAVYEMLLTATDRESKIGEDFRFTVVFDITPKIILVQGP